MVKSFLLLFCFTLVFTAALNAQFLRPQAHSTLSPNIIFLEVLGNGGKLSLNYEQLFLQTDNIGASGRFGFAAFPEGEGVIDYGIPATLSFLAGAQNLYAEIGGGTRIAFDNNWLEDGFEIIPTGILGVRYHPDKNGGIFFKLAYTPSYQEEVIRHSAGFAIGIGLDR
ncbi:MAG: hypothetical protein AAFN10_09945 [Bacteroidota bacterium]